MYSASAIPSEVTAGITDYDGTEPSTNKHLSCLVAGMGKK